MNFQEPKEIQAHLEIIVDELRYLFYEGWVVEDKDLGTDP